MSHKNERNSCAQSYYRCRFVLGGLTVRRPAATGQWPIVWCAVLPEQCHPVQGACYVQLASPKPIFGTESSFEIESSFGQAPPPPQEESRPMPPMASDAQQTWGSCPQTIRFKSLQYLYDFFIECLLSLPV
eukprot:365538-Chlamydomonas_euryale.AAC.8